MITEINMDIGPKLRELVRSGGLSTGFSALNGQGFFSLWRPNSAIILYDLIYVANPGGATKGTNDHVVTLWDIAGNAITTITFANAALNLSAGWANRNRYIFSNGGFRILPSVGPFSIVMASPAGGATGDVTAMVRYYFEDSRGLEP